MRSPQLIERPGRWVLMVVAPLALAFGLAAFMIGRFVGFGTSFDLGSGFAKALQSSLLLDEPFGGLDPLSREARIKDVARLVAELGTTLVLVTHDPREAVVLCDRAIVRSFSMSVG